MIQQKTIKYTTQRILFDYKILLFDINHNRHSDRYNSLRKIALDDTWFLKHPMNSDTIDVAHLYITRFKRDHLLNIILKSYSKVLVTNKTYIFKHKI